MIPNDDYMLRNPNLIMSLKKASSRAFSFKVLLILLSAPVNSLAGDTLNSSNNASNSTNNDQAISFVNGAAPTQTNTTVESTVSPAMGGFSGSFSTDYCGATMQGSVGIVGIGFSVGGPKIDDSCVMLRTFERTQQAASAIAQVDAAKAELLRKASIEILGLIDPKVRLIFEKAGLIPGETKLSNIQTNKSEENLDQNYQTQGLNYNLSFFQNINAQSKNKIVRNEELRENSRDNLEQNQKLESIKSTSPSSHLILHH